MGEIYFICGPPTSGRTTLAEALARRLDLPFMDIEARLVERGGKLPAAAPEAEAIRRAHEADALRQVVAEGRRVVSLDTGTLLAPANLALAEDAGTILRLEAEDSAPSEDQVQAAQSALGAFRVAGMGAAYDVRVGDGWLDGLGALCLARGCKGRALVVGDAHTLPAHGPRVLRVLRAAGLEATGCTLPAGEAHKTVETVQILWRAMLDAHIERGDTVFALGGGVVGDLTGFAAATWLRGVRWVGLPTSLLAMVDASLGGKTGADLPQGKNLVGAFHPPALVVTDTETLATLPDEEFRAGLAEAVKHGVIGDPELFDLCAEGFAQLRDNPAAGFVSRAMAVKIRTIAHDHYEKGLRAALNLGHTVGHGVEQAMDFSLRHGEAVAIGMVAEARLAERIGLAHPGLSGLIAGVLNGLGLPTELPAGLDRAACWAAMQRDKKRADGVVRFALPVRIGEVRTGVTVEPSVWQAVAGV